MASSCEMRDRRADPMMTSCMWYQQGTAWIHLGLLSSDWPHPSTVAGQLDRFRSEPLDLSSHCAAVLGLLDHWTSKNFLHSIAFFLSRDQSRIMHFINCICHVSLMSFNLKYFFHLPSFPLTLTFLDGISFIVSHQDTDNVNVNFIRGFPGGSVVKNPPAMPAMPV